MILSVLLLSALSMVDAVLLFDELTPNECLKTLKMSVCLAPEEGIFGALIDVSDAFAVIVSFVELRSKVGDDDSWGA